MDLGAFLDHMDRGSPVSGGSEIHLVMCELAQVSLRIHDPAR